MLFSFVNNWHHSLTRIQGDRFQSQSSCIEWKTNSTNTWTARTQVEKSVCSFISRSLSIRRATTKIGKKLAHCIITTQSTQYTHMIHTSHMVIWLNGRTYTTNLNFFRRYLFMYTSKDKKEVHTHTHNMYCWYTIHDVQ